MLFFTSALTGILPVPGRVTVTAGVLDTIAPKDPVKRAKFGIIDYLSTHHYYLWSPLEKTIIIPMAVLGLSYGAVIYMLAPLLILSLLFVCSYIIFYVKEEDIELNFTSDIVNYTRMLNILPFIIGIILIALSYNAAIVFGVVTLWYVLYFKVSVNEIYASINFKLLIIVFSIILIGNVTHIYTADINAYLAAMKFTMDSLIGVLTISSIAFGSAFILGSSSRFSGIVSLLALTFGVQYFIFFFALEFAAYLVSPVHKCVIIGNTYFGTPLKKYYKVLITWAILLILISCFIVFL